DAHWHRHRQGAFGPGMAAAGGEAASRRAATCKSGGLPGMASISASRGRPWMVDASTPTVKGWLGSISTSRTLPILPLTAFALRIFCRLINQLRAAEAAVLFLCHDCRGGGAQLQFAAERFIGGAMARAIRARDLAIVRTGVSGAMRTGEHES